jgi:glyoxylase-like metal-dependent hydrolase (beta-lactamase superfamily II)
MKQSIQKPDVSTFYDKQTSTFSYVVKDPQSNACAIIDSVLNLDYNSGRTSYRGADEIIDFIKRNHLQLQWIIETHVHADHLSAAPYLKEKLGGQLGIGAHITTVQNVFGKVFNAGSDFQRDGSQFDRLFNDGDTYQIGSLTATAIHTPANIKITHILVLTQILLILK